MYQWSWRSSLIALFVAGQMSVAVHPAQAGPILDWLFGPQATTSRRVVTYYVPAPSYYSGQVVSNYQGYASTTPTVVYRVPNATYANAAYPSATYSSAVAAYPSSGSALAYSAPTTTTYRVSSAYLPPTATRTAATTCYSPTVTYQAPQNLCSPAPVACAPQPRTSSWGLGSCLGRRSSSTTTVARVPRQAYYRTSWKQIPVTSYRPITSTDPITGAPVTVMKACTTYTWQPTRRRCGFFGRLFGRCDPGPAATTCTPTCAPTPCATQYVESSSCCGPASATVTPCGPTMSAPAASPYYTPTPAAPSAGASVFPPVTLPPTNLAPPVGPPSGSNVMPPSGSNVMPPSGRPQPADTRPSLLVPGTPGTSSGIAPPQPPSTSSYTPSPSHWNNGIPGTVTPPANDAGTAGTSRPSPTAPHASVNRMVPLPAASGPVLPRNNMNLRPVPDPDAKPTLHEDNANAPHLLDPRDQSASLRASQAWAYTTISWSQPQQRVPRRVTARTAKPQHEVLDDTGWYSVAQ